VDSAVDTAGRRAACRLLWRVGAGHRLAGMDGNNGDGMREALIMALHLQGYSVRSIAREVGLSRSRVHQIITAQTAKARDVSEAEERLSMLDAETDDGLVPPFRFVGLEPPQGGRSAQERFVDGNGKPCNVLGIWRADRDPDCPSVALGYLADCNRQVEAAGYERHNRGDGSWEWRPQSSADRPQHI